MKDQNEKPVLWKGNITNDQLDNQISFALNNWDKELAVKPDMITIRDLLQKKGENPVQAMWDYLFTTDPQDRILLWKTVDRLYKNKSHNLEALIYKNIALTSINPAAIFVLLSLLETEKWHREKTSETGFSIRDNDNKYWIIARTFITKRMSFHIRYLEADIGLTAKIILVPKIPETVATALIGRPVHDLVKLPNFENHRILEINAGNTTNRSEIITTHMYDTTITVSDIAEAELSGDYPECLR